MPGSDSYGALQSMLTRAWTAYSASLSRGGHQPTGGGITARGALLAGRSIFEEFESEGRIPRDTKQ